jgi:hypothetical protein
MEVFSENSIFRKNLNSQTAYSRDGQKKDLAKKDKVILFLLDWLVSEI